MAKTQVKKATKSDGFSSSLGVVFAAAGSAVGIGNLLFVTGRVQNYGALFFIPYTIFMLIIGLPLMIGEFSVGKSKRSDVVTMTDDAPTVGWFALVNVLFIASFYFLIGGALIMAVGYSLTVMGEADGATLVRDYLYSIFSGGFNDNGVMINPIGLLISTLAFLALNMFILKKGISSGIEKLTTFAMPALLITLFGLAIYSLIVGGDGNPFDMFTKWAFDAEVDAGANNYGSAIGVISAAVGKAFLSLSLGMGIVFTYGGYMKKDEDVVKSTLLTIVADWGVILLASISTIALGSWFAMPMPLVLLLMILVLLAALTSSVSILEVPIKVGETKMKMTRDKSIIGVGSIIAAVALLGMIAFANNIAFVTMLDHLTEGYLFLFIGLLTTLYLGWRAKPWGDIKQPWLVSYLNITTRYVIPAFLAFIWLYQLGFIGQYFTL